MDNFKLVTSEEAELEVRAFIRSSVLDCSQALEDGIYERLPKNTCVSKQDIFSILELLVGFENGGN